MGYWEERRLRDGGTERIHYESDGSPSGLREFSNPNNNLSKKDYDSLMDAYYTDQDPSYKSRCTCGGIYQATNREVRGGLFGLGRKGRMSNEVECGKCGRRDYV